MKKLIFLILVLSGIAQAQYNSVLNIAVRSGTAVPGSCSPDGSFFFKTSTTKDWYKCIAGSWVAFGSISGTVTSVGLSTDSSFLTVASSPITGAGTMTLNLTTGLAANKALMTPNGSTGTVTLRTIDVADIGSGAFTLAGARFANNGTATTLLHGNAAGNPAFGQVVNADITNATIDVTTKITGIVPGANGGSGNGFFAVSGPASTLKTFTFPNASAVVLTDNAAVTATQGGSGVSNPTAHGILLGEGASAFTPLVCGADTVLHGLAAADPNCAAITNATGGATAVTYDTSTHAFGALSNILTASLTATRVPFAFGANALTDSANFTYAAASGISLIQGANAADAIFTKRATDTAPTGNFLHFVNAANSADLFKIDVAGNATATSYSATNASGVAGMASLIQGTAATPVSNAVNLMAPTSVTAYTLTYPGAIAAGLWRTNSSGVYSIAELSGDATTSTSNAVTVVKVNGVTYAASPSTDTIPTVTAASTVIYEPIATCNADATHANQYNPATHRFECNAITATAAPAGADTQIQYNNSGAAGASAAFVFNKTDTVTIGTASSVLGKLALAGNTSGSTTLVGAAAGGGTWTLRNTTDNVLGAATTDTLTNKSVNATNNTITNLTGAMMTNNTVTATQLAAQYSKGSCTEAWGGSGTSFALTSGDDAIVNNVCYNDSGVTRTITAVKCRSDNASNTTTVNPTFGSAGTGTTILSGALTCGNSYAYSSTGTVSNASWTTGTGIRPAMAGTLTGTSIAMIVEFTF